MAPSRTTLAGALIAPTIALAVAAGAWKTRSAPLTYGSVADFTLTERSGRPFSRAELDGHPWVADFVFTRCGGPCPLLSSGMAKLHETLGRTDARIVSFTVDPEHDSPAVLAEYAKAHGASEKWVFLTGDVNAVSSVVYDSFHLPILRNAGVPVGQLVTHSTRIALVDREGKIRGYYEGTRPVDPAQPESALEVNDAEIDRLRHDLRALGNGSQLPLVNACLNATSALFLFAGFLLIRSGRDTAHAGAMLGALAVSAVFLGFYLTYHALYPERPYGYPGISKALYLAVLIPHVTLAIPVVPLALATAWAGLRGNLERHRKLARVTFPLWMYVCVTGVAVYVLLHEG